MASNRIDKLSSSKEQTKSSKQKIAIEVEGDQSSVDSQIFLKSPIAINEISIHKDNNELQLFKVNQGEFKTQQQSSRNNETTNQFINTSHFQNGQPAKTFNLEDTCFENGQQSNRVNDQGVMETTIKRLEQQNQSGSEQLIMDNTGQNKDQLTNKSKEKQDKRQQKAGKNMKKGQTSKMTESNNNVTNFKLIANAKKRMMYFFKNFTSSGRRQYLQNYNVRWMIDDQCDSVDIVSKKKFFIIRFLISIQQRILRLNFYHKAQNIMNLLNPHSKFSTFLQFFFTFFNSIFYLALSIIIIYNVTSDSHGLFYLIVVLVFVAEILVQLNTKFYQGSHLISDRYMILIHYFKTRAAYDIIATLLLSSLPTNTTLKVICQCLSFMKVVNVMEDISSVQQILCMTFKNYYMIQLINLILKILVVGHVIACSYYLVGQIELNLLSYETTWYDEGLSVEHIWWELYLESMYWSLTLLTTGSNVAYTILQMFFTTFIMLFTTILFGYLMNVTGTIISEFDQQEQNKQLDLNIINQYMRSNNISKELRSQINRDIENYYKSDIESQSQDKANIFKKISPNLQALLKTEYSSQILNKVQVINDKFSSELKEELATYLEEAFYLPNQIIFSESQFTDLSLYFIVDGKVELSHTFLKEDKTSKVVQRIEAGSLLGQINFFTGSAYDKTARSNEFTKVVKIERDKFVEVVRKREKDFQVFCEIRDQLMVYENFELVGEKCSFCKNSTHLEQECHLIHIQKDEIYQRIRFYQNKTQDRKAYQRKCSFSTKYKTLQNRKQQQVSLKKYRSVYTPKLEIDNHEQNSQDEDGDNEDEFQEEEEEEEFDEESESFSLSIHNNETKEQQNKDTKKSEPSQTTLSKKDSKLIQSQNIEYSPTLQVEDVKNFENNKIQNIAELKISSNKKSQYPEDKVAQDPVITVTINNFAQSSSLLSFAAEDFVISSNSNHTTSNAIFNNIQGDQKEIESNHNKESNNIHNAMTEKGSLNEDEHGLTQQISSNDNLSLKKKQTSHNNDNPSIKRKSTFNDNPSLKRKLTGNDSKTKRNSKFGYQKGNNNNNSILQDLQEITEKNMSLIFQDSNRSPQSTSKNKKGRKSSIMQMSNSSILQMSNSIVNGTRKSILDLSKNRSSLEKQFGYQGYNLHSNLQQIEEEYQPCTGNKSNNSNQEFTQKKALNQLLEDEYGQQKSSQNYQNNISEWDFEKLQDYIYYFPKGNSKFILIRRIKNQKSKLKISTKRKILNK